MKILQNIVKVVKTKYNMNEENREEREREIFSLTL